MKFNCNKISISDEEFGCTLTFSEKEETDISSMDLTIEEIISSSDQYVLLQRTYAEDDLDREYFYIETSDFEKAGEYHNISVNLWRTLFVLKYDDEVIEVNFDTDDLEFENLKSILEKIINKNGQLIVHE